MRHSRQFLYNHIDYDKNVDNYNIQSGNQDCVTVTINAKLSSAGGGPLHGNESYNVMIYTNTDCSGSECSLGSGGVATLVLWTAFKVG